MQLEVLFFLFLAGIVCGAINAIAGGATLIGFPVLISVGLPPIVANASNFLATMPGYAAAIPSYITELRTMGRSTLSIVIFSMCGGTLGSLLLIVSPSHFFSQLTPYLLVVATLLYAFGGPLNIWIGNKTNQTDLKKSKSGKAAIFIFSVYGGYFGAGLGIIVLSLLRIIGYVDFHQANALKNVMVTAVSIMSISIFIMSGLVAWPESIAMMLGATIGGYFSAKYARFFPQIILKSFIILLGSVFSIYYFLQG